MVHRYFAGLCPVRAAPAARFDSNAQEGEMGVQCPQGILDSGHNDVQDATRGAKGLKAHQPQQEINQRAGHGTHLCPFSKASEL